MYSSPEIEATDLTGGLERKPEDVRDCIELALCYMAKVESLHVAGTIIDGQLAEGVRLFE